MKENSEQIPKEEAGQQLKKEMALNRESLRLTLQFNDLKLWIDLIDMEDLTKKEIKKLTVEYNHAANSVKKINETIVSHHKRMLEEGTNLFQRKKERQCSESFRKNLLSGVLNRN